MHIFISLSRGGKDSVTFPKRSTIVSSFGWLALITLHCTIARSDLAGNVSFLPCWSRSIDTSQRLVGKRPHHRGGGYLQESHDPSNTVSGCAKTFVRRRSQAALKIKNDRPVCGAVGAFVVAVWEKVLISAVVEGCHGSVTW